MSNNVIDILRGTLVDGYPKKYRVRKLVKNWPMIGNADEDTTEELDLENFNILAISKDILKLCAGGDWQEPLTITLMADGDKLIVLSQTEGFESEGLTKKDIKKIFEE